MHKNLETTEAKISEFNQDYPPFREAIHTTKTLLQKIKNRLGPEVHFLLLHVGGYDDPYYQAIASICEELCIDFIREVSENTLLNNTEPEVMAKDHFHWNEKGHQIAADALLKYLSPIFGEDFSKISATDVVRPQD